MNPINNTIYSHHDASFLQLQNEENTLEDNNNSLQLRRQQVFFSPYEQDENTDLLHLVNQNLTQPYNNCFYQQINTTDINQLKQLCVEQLNKLIVTVNSYDDDDDNSNKKNIKKFITRIKDYSDTHTILQYITCCIYEIVISLNKFNTEQQNSINKNQHLHTTMSKNAIGSRLKVLLNNLDKCWDGTYHRLHTENEILNNIDKGLAGKIFLIKKNLVDILIMKYIKNSELVSLESIHIHTQSAMINLISTIFGLAPKVDTKAPLYLPINFITDFYQTATIEISEAVIARELTNDFYQQLISTFKAKNKSCWLTENVSIEDFTSEIMHDLDINFFIPINMLFDSEQTDNKLTI